MGLTYTVKKSKMNRLSYRIIGIVFLSLGIMGMALVWKVPAMQFLVIAVALIAAFYGIYLIKASLRQQAYDITYEFTEEHIKLKHHRGEQIIPYDEVSGLQWIEPSPDIDYFMIQIRIGKKQYVLHFNNNRKYGEKIFAYLNERVPML